MRTLIVVAIVISSLSLISAMGAVIAIATMSDLRHHVDYFWLSTGLQLCTGLFVLWASAIWLRKRLYGHKHLIPILFFILINVIDVVHAILAYADWPYALGAALFRIFPLSLLVLAIYRNRDYSTTYRIQTNDG